MRTRQDNDVVVIWAKNKGCDPGLQGGDYSGTSKRWVALNARGRRIFICDAFNKQFFISERVNAVQWKTPEREYRLHHEPYRRISKARSNSYWKYMRRQMVYGGARIMRLPKGLQ